MGLFLVDKPAGPTSFDVLRQLRPALGRKLGHAGTLDPFATG
ncbi:MAG: tRNA pseudouridine55 synthase, partial [Gaiellales bacterium]|nr:tRNA pseudouridine55 synthase [Gaiellales bacterium]